MIRDPATIFLRNGPLENLWGGTAGEVPKKYPRKGKPNEKNSCTPINPNKYSCYDLEQKSYEEFDKEKNSCGENSLPLS